MGHLNVFRSLTSVDGLLGFYTKETKDKIPELPGCYAWFLPLWFYRSNLDELMQLVSGVLDYEQDPEKEVEAPFTWESVKLRVRRGAAIQTSDSVRATWERLLADDHAHGALQDTLMRASLLMPPLYVGRTRNLRRRYLQHTIKSDKSKNDFHSRFAECAAALQLQLSVSDLLFVSVRTEYELSQVLSDVAQDDTELLIEQMLMQFCRPPFSLR